MNRQAVDTPPRPGDRHQVPPAWRSRLSRQAASETTSQITSPTTSPTTRLATPDHQPGSPAGTTSQDRQPPAPPTHRIIAPPGHQATSLVKHHQDDEEDYAPASMGEHIADAFNELRFVRNSPGCLRDQIEYARDGAYTTRIDGWWRRVNIVFAYFIAAPGLTVCYLTAWAFFTRLSRALIAWPTLAFLLMFLNRIPLTEFLIPDSADFTNWF